MQRVAIGCPSSAEVSGLGIESNIYVCIGWPKGQAGIPATPSAVPIRARFWTAQLLAASSSHSGCSWSILACTTQDFLSIAAQMGSSQWMLFYAEQWWRLVKTMQCSS